MSAALSKANIHFERECLNSVPWHNVIIRKVEKGECVAVATHSPHVKNVVLPAVPCSALSVMNFNLLANCYCPKHTADVITFEKRKQLNFQHIIGARPKILVTEEMDNDYVEMLESVDYQVVNKAKKDDSGEYTGVFFLKNSGMRALNTEVVKIDPIGQRHQFAILARVEFQQQICGGLVTPYQFIMVAFHAKAGRSDEMEEARTRDNHNIVTRLIPEFISKCLEKEQKEGTSSSTSSGSGNGSSGINVQNLLMNRILWIGDFNAGPHSYDGQYPCRVVPWILEGKDPKHNENCGVPENPIKFVSAYKQFHGEHPIFTTCKWREEKVICQTIDYIFMTPELGECVGTLENPSKDPVKELQPTYLPCPGKWGSDHLSVYCEIEIQHSRLAEAKMVEEMKAKRN